MANPQRSTNVVTEAMGDGLGVFDRARNQSYVLNATSALVFQHCDGQTTPQQLAELLRQKFNLSGQQAEKLLGLSLAELAKANLLEGSVERPADPGRRQLIATLARAGLALVLLPVVAPIEVQAAGDDTLIPLLDCVTDNGDGTFTAHFGYVNQSSQTITLAVGPKNKFEPPPQGRGQPTTFLPGEHHDVFTVVFDGSKIKWMLKADGDRRHQVEASSSSPACPPPPTTTAGPPTTGAPPTTTAGPPPTTTAGPPPTTTAGPPPTTTAGPPPTTTSGPPPTTTPPPPTTTTIEI